MTPWSPVGRTSALSFDSARWLHVGADTQRFFSVGLVRPYRNRPYLGTRGCSTGSGKAKKKATLSSGGHHGETILRRASRDATTRFVKMSFAISAQATCARVTGGVAVRRNEGARSRPCPRCRHRLLEGFRVLSWQRRKFVPLRPRPLDASHGRGPFGGPSHSRRTAPDTREACTPSFEARH